MLWLRNVPKLFWGKATAVAAHIYNFVMARGFTATTITIEIVLGNKPNYLNLWFLNASAGTRAVSSLNNGSAQSLKSDYGNL